MAGKTTALEATTSWQSAEARYSTHLTAAAGFLVPAQMESARPLNMHGALAFRALRGGGDADFDALVAGVLADHPGAVWR